MGVSGLIHQVLKSSRNLRQRFSLLYSPGYKSYHFVGIGGSGMNALAQIIAEQGVIVSGSDRNYDCGINLQLFNKLTAQGILLFKQDGSGLQRDVDCLVISTAIEDDNPDIKIARQRGIPLLHRAELLAQTTNSLSKSIAVAGTSGKTTVVGMIAYILLLSGKKPLVINGGIMKNFCQGNLVGNAIPGEGDYCVIETDESDGSITRFKPKIGVITNITLDHKPLPILQDMFNQFAAQVTGTLILNQDCVGASQIRGGYRRLTFALEHKADLLAKELEQTGLGTSFKVSDLVYQIRLPGRHNVSNALAAIAAAKAVGIDDLTIARALNEFMGIKRRLELIAEVKGVTVFDDYAHNPEKIRATLETLKPYYSRLFIVFQPHGFVPTKLLKEELIEVFSQSLRPQDSLYMPEIYYAGGTISCQISSHDLITGIQERQGQAFYIPLRSEIIGRITRDVRSGDGIVVMGARDDSLSSFCVEIAADIKKSRTY